MGAAERFALRAAGAILVIATTATGSLAATAERASAEPVEILVSSDGVEFAPALDGDFLDGLGRIVPGGSVTTALWIMNPSETTASMRLSARGLRTPSTAFAEAVSLTTVDPATGWWSSATLADLASCGVIVHSTPLAAGAVMELSMTFTMAESVDGVTAQSETADLSMVVAMRDIEGGAFATSGCGDDDLAPTGGGPGQPTGTQPGPVETQPVPAGALPGSLSGLLGSTGAQFAVEIAAIGALLGGFGLFFLLASRRRRADERS